MTAATGTLIYALIQAGGRGWASAATGVLASAAVGPYLAFVARVRHAANPLMNLNCSPAVPWRSGRCWCSWPPR